MSICKPCVKDVGAARNRAGRDKVLAHYGGRCGCCGEARREFLAIDHINGGGKQHRREMGLHLTQWLVRNGFPAGFQLLCHNCNTAKGLYGACPHTKRPSAAV